MSTFDPTQPVVVHEQVNDVAVEWVPVSLEEWQSKAEWFDEARTIVRWDKMRLLDAWWPVAEEASPPADPSPRASAGPPADSGDEADSQAAA